MENHELRAETRLLAWPLSHKWPLFCFIISRPSLPIITYLINFYRIIIIGIYIVGLSYNYSL